MSRKAAKETKPKPRGLQGGRKAKYIRPGEGVEMTKMTFRIRTDIAEQIVDTAAAEGMSKDEWLMRKVSPQWMATLDAWHASQRQSREAENDPSAGTGEPGPRLPGQ